MDFSLDRFYELNRKAIIWIILFLLIYLLRRFFTLIFLTFIIGFFAMPAAQFLSERFKLSRRFSIIVVYSSFLVGYLALYLLTIPSLMMQAGALQAQLPSIRNNVYQLRDRYVEKYPNSAQLFGIYAEPSLLRQGEIIDAKGFFEKLVEQYEEGAPNPGRRMLELLSEPTRQKLREAITEAPVELGDEPLLISPPPLSPAKRIEPIIIQEINSKILKEPGFYNYADFAAINVRDQEKLQQLITRRQNELDERELQRRNRLILEAAFPENIVPSQVPEDELQSILDRAQLWLQSKFPQFGLVALTFFLNSLLAIFFSFLISLDYVRLSREVRSLASSKLRDFYEEAGQPVVKFALDVGHGFKAIVIIALITTLMFIPVLVIMRVPSITLLCTIIFLTSLLPVVGVPLEASAIFIFTFNERGLESALGMMAWLVFIHFIIGYVITPIIFGRQFRINLVAVLLILFIGNQVGGAWGMILGVPVAVYILREVLKIPFGDDKETQNQLAPETLQSTMGEVGGED